MKLLSLEFINVISLLLLIILEYVTTSIVNNAVCYYDDCLILVRHVVSFRSTGACLKVTNTVLNYINGTRGHRITQWNNTVMSPAQLQVYANAVSVKGSPLDNCFGFIDGTVRPICRPRENQRVVYNVLIWLTGLLGSGISGLVFRCLLYFCSHEYVSKKSSFSV